MIPAPKTAEICQLYGCFLPFLSFCHCLAWNEKLSKFWKCRFFTLMGCRDALNQKNLKTIYSKKDKIILNRKAISLFQLLNFCHFFYWKKYFGEKIWGKMIRGSHGLEYRSYLKVEEADPKYFVWFFVSQFSSLFLYMPLFGRIW